MFIILLFFPNNLNSLSPFLKCSSADKKKSDLCLKILVLEDLEISPEKREYAKNIKLVSEAMGQVATGHIHPISSKKGPCGRAATLDAK